MKLKIFALLMAVAVMCGSCANSYQYAGLKRNDRFVNRNPRVF